MADTKIGPIMATIHKSYDIIKDPKHWTQEFYQKDENGKNCPWREGYSFCALGSVNYVAGISDDDKGYHGAICILQRHSEKMFNGQALQVVNDSLPSALAYQNVLRVFESVIKKFPDREPTEEEIVEGVWPKSNLKSPLPLGTAENVPCSLEHCIGKID